SGVMEAFPQLPVVDASAGIELLCAEEEHDHGHDHDHGESNAHVWLDAKNAQTMVRNLADGLMAACPASAEQIAANRDAYIARLAALDQELTDELAELPRKDIITFHEAFPYFAQAYGLNVAAVVNREPSDALSPAKLAELVKTVRDLGVPPLFVEPQYEDMAAQTLARETGAKLYTLDPVVTGPVTDVPLTYYEDVMRANVQVLLTALTAD
ncbi:MAG: zinc ABC transporter substrate-binding protein, partial [Clostridia bacterium]|nr:zinc ABC transporter substrate-binding protein [Clostridia bacterium]